MGRHKPNRPRRTPGVGRARVDFDHHADALAVAGRLVTVGCPHCGARGELRPGRPDEVLVSVSHRPSCPELADPGHLGDH